MALTDNAVSVPLSPLVALLTALAALVCGGLSVWKVALEIQKIRVAPLEGELSTAEATTTAAHASQSKGAKRYVRNVALLAALPWLGCIVAVFGWAWNFYVTQRYGEVVVDYAKHELDVVAERKAAFQKDKGLKSDLASIQKKLDDIQVKTHRCSFETKFFPNNRVVLPLFACHGLAPGRLKATLKGVITEVS